MNEKTHNELLDTAIRLLTPLVLMFGVYLMLSGANTPGGGFQAGAILSAIFMIRYLARPTAELLDHQLRLLEKLFFLLILIFGSLCILQEVLMLQHMMRSAFLILMNILIGMKVMCGLTIIFVRFVVMEGAEG